MIPKLSVSDFTRGGWLLSLLRQKTYLLTGKFRNIAHREKSFCVWTLFIKSYKMRSLVRKSPTAHMGYSPSKYFIYDVLNAAVKNFLHVWVDKEKLALTVVSNDIKQMGRVALLIRKPNLEVLSRKIDCDDPVILLMDGFVDQIVTAKKKQLQISSRFFGLCQ